MNIRGPIIDPATGTTLDRAVTLYLNLPSTATTNNGNLVLWVDSGTTKLGGAVNIGYEGFVSTFDTLGNLVVPSSITGTHFGDGSHLTGIPSTGSIVGVYLPLAGGTVTGNLFATSSTTLTRLTVGTDLGVFPLGGNSSMIGNTAGDSNFLMGQSYGRSFVGQWKYNATVGSAYQAFYTSGYSNPLYYDASLLGLNTLSGGPTSIGLGAAQSTFTVAGNLTLPYGVTGATAAFTGLVSGGSFLGVSGATETTTAALTGVGTAANPLGVNSSSVAVLSGGFVLNAQLDGSSVTKQGNTFNGNSQLVKTNSSGQLPAISATNLTGTAPSLTSGNVTTNANLTGDITSSGNSTTAAATQPNITTLSGLTTVNHVFTVSASSVTISAITSGPSGQLTLDSNNGNGPVLKLTNNGTAGGAIGNLQGLGQIDFSTAAYNTPVMMSIQGNGVHVGCLTGTQVYYCNGGTLNDQLYRGNGGAGALACVTGGGTITAENMYICP